MHVYLSKGVIEKIMTDKSLQVLLTQLDAIKYNLTKLTRKSNADWQCGYLLRAVVVCGAWPGHMLT